MERGRGGPALARDDERRALLIERLRPGRRLWDLPDGKATEIAAGLLEQLWIRADRPFRRLENMAARWVEELPTRGLDRKLVDRAVTFLPEAGPTQRESVLLHQDFHGANVLDSARGWLAIDPKPLVGEREFDTASLLRDRRWELRNDPGAAARVRRRLDRLSADLGLDRDRMRGWGIAHALAWGSGEDDMVACARWLAAA